MTTQDAWMALLSQDEVLALPWTGGRALRGDGRVWSIRGPLPDEHGWHAFTINGSRRARWREPAAPSPERLERYPMRRGYLVGDRLIPDSARPLPRAISDRSRPPQTIRDRSRRPGRAQLLEQTTPLGLVQPGLPRFSRIGAVHYEGATWLYARQEFPLGPELSVSDAFADRQPEISGIEGVTPALELAFQIESWRRDRAEYERALAQERREAAARAQRHIEQIRTGAGRRQLAAENFEAAARAALHISGAELLDHHPAARRGEASVRFRYQHRRFSCVVDTATLRIIDAGICLEDHATGERGDTYFTLESLPAVISQALQEGSLVVF